MPEIDSSPKYPDVVVRLSDTDGNAYSIMGCITKALRRAGHADAIDAFRAEATAGDYDHLLQTAMKWVEVE